MERREMYSSGLVGNNSARSGWAPRDAYAPGFVANRALARTPENDWGTVMDRRDPYSSTSVVRDTYASGGVGNRTTDEWASRDTYTSPATGSRSLRSPPDPEHPSKPNDFFYSHVWANDEEGRNNHERVKKISWRMKALGFTCWLDEGQLATTGGLGTVCSTLAGAVDASTIYVACITSAYIMRVRDGNRAGGTDTSQFEFEYAMSRVDDHCKVSLVMEQWCRDPRSWAGPVGTGMGSKLYIDFSDDSKLDSAVERLAHALWNVIPSYRRQNGTEIPPSIAPPPRLPAPALAANEVRLRDGDSISIHKLDGRFVVGRLAVRDGQAAYVVETESIVAPAISAHDVLPDYSGKVHVVKDPVRDAQLGLARASISPVAAAATTRVVVGEDSTRYPRNKGHVHTDFHIGEPVSVVRSDGRRTVGMVKFLRPGTITVQCEADGTCKDVPELEVSKLLGSYRF